MKRSALSILCLQLCIAMASGRPDGFLIDRSGPRSSLIHPGPDGKLRYVPDARGDTVLDFSNCGYAGGGVAIPEVATVMTLAPCPDGDDTARIQAAIDQLAERELDGSGFRGALLLKRGTYRIEGALHIQAAGIVLRGEGQGEHGTILMALGKGTRTLIEVAGEGSVKLDLHAQQSIVDERVPVGARWVTVADAGDFSVGQNVFIERSGNAEWIHAIGMDRILTRPDGTKPTKQWTHFSLSFDRMITAIEGNRIELDAPIACAIEQQWGGGRVIGCRFPGRISNCGVEHLRLVSAFDETVTDAQEGLGTYYSDEEHSSNPVTLKNVSPGWVRNITMRHFRSGISLDEGTKWVTVQDCVSMDMVAKIFGGRRGVFGSNGQLNLVQRCYAETARHAFVVGSRVCGPNAFVDCISRREFNSSEPHHRWSVGGLYDNVHGLHRFQSPPTARNIAIGHVGSRDPGYFVLKGQEWQEENPGKPLPLYYSQEEGFWDSHGTHVSPRSLYLAQLEDRLGSAAVRNVAVPAQLDGTIDKAVLKHARGQGAKHTTDEPRSIGSDQLF